MLSKGSNEGWPLAALFNRRNQLSTSIRKLGESSLELKEDGGSCVPVFADTVSFELLIGCHSLLI